MKTNRTRTPAAAPAVFDPLAAMAAESRTTAAAMAASAARVTVWQAAIRAAFSDDDGFPMHGDDSRLPAVVEAVKAAAEFARESFAAALNEGRTTVTLSGFEYSIEADKKGEVRAPSKQKPVKRLSDVGSKLAAALELGAEAAAVLIEPTDTGFKVRPENKAEALISEAKEAARLAKLSPFRRAMAEAEAAAAAVEAAREAEAEAEAALDAAKAARMKAEAEAEAKASALSDMEAAAARVANVEAEAAARVAEAEAKAAAARAEAEAAAAARKGESRARKAAQAARAEAAAALLDLEYKVDAERKAAAA